MRVTKVQAKLRFSMRKNTQMTQTVMKVRMTEGTVPIFFITLPRKSLSRQMKRPCKAPQTTKFHDAPCHKPLSRKQSQRLRYMRPVPLRLPPSGM